MSKELQDLHHKLRHDRDARNLAVVQAKEILMAKDRYPLTSSIYKRMCMFV
jgi:chemotaxis regulatin CheY-phosphate phosphatase CheZ